MARLRLLLIPLVLFGMYAAFGAAWLGFVPLFPEIRETLGVDQQSAMRLINIVSMVKALAPILAGLAAARFGLTSTMRAAAVLMLFGLLVPWLPSFPLWMVARFFFGVGGAIWFALMGAVVVDVVPAGGRPFVNALNGVAVNTGAVIGLTYALPLHAALGLQKTLALFCAAIAFFFVVLLLVGPLSTSKPPVVTAHALFSSYAKVLKEKATWFVAFAFTGPLALYLVLSTFLTSSLIEAHDLPRVEAVRWLIHLMKWGIPASIAVGLLLHHKLGPPRLHIVIGALAAPVAIYLAMHATTEDARKIWFGFVGAALFWPVAPLLTVVQRQPDMTPARVGMVLGTMASVSYIASALVPEVVGVVVAAKAATGAEAIVCCSVLGVTPLVAMLLPGERG